MITTCARDRRTWKNDYPEGPIACGACGFAAFRSAAARRGAFASSPTRTRRPPARRADELEWVRRSVRVSRRVARPPETTATPATPWSSFSLPRDHGPGCRRGPNAAFCFPTCSSYPLSLRALDRTSSDARWDWFPEPSAAGRNFLRAIRPEEVVGIGIDPLPAGIPAAPAGPAGRARRGPRRRPAGATRSPEVERTDRRVPFRRRHRLYGLRAVRRTRRARQRLRRDARILRRLRGADARSSSC